MPNPMSSLESGKSVIIIIVSKNLFLSIYDDEFELTKTDTVSQSPFQNTCMH